MLAGQAAMTGGTLEVMSNMDMSVLGNALPLSTVTQLQLSLRAQDLPKSDLFSKSDPMAVVSVKQGPQAQWVEAGRTEVLKDEHNPKWANKITIDYNFEARQFIRLAVYDVDSGNTEKLGEQELLGKFETTVAAVVSAQCKQFTAVLRESPGTSKAKIHAYVEEAAKHRNDMVQLQLCGHDLDNKDTFGKSDPFYVISRSSPSGDYVVVCRSEVIKNNLSPMWRPTKRRMHDLCSGDLDKPIKVEIFDYDGNSDHDLIGTFYTSYNQMLASYKDQTRLDVINPKKAAKKKSYKNSGTVSVKYLESFTHNSFVDFLQAGTKMNFSVAVDFTASNGDPRNPDSLHYRNPEAGGENAYTAAIRAVGEIIEEYDADRQFPALGFGAKVPPNNVFVNHEFFLNVDSGNPFCNGVDGILRAYDVAHSRVQLHGPTFFTPVIQHVSRFAEAYRAQGQQYFVLLILTDGEITDLDETKAAICDASMFPMSIIIVGVGRADFSSMVALDSDKGLLRAPGGKVAKRDIVQFVEMNKFLTPDWKGYDKVALAKHVLQEVPNQVAGYMLMRGLTPDSVRKSFGSESDNF